MMSAKSGLNPSVRAAFIERLRGLTEEELLQLLEDKLASCSDSASLEETDLILDELDRKAQTEAEGAFDPETSLLEFKDKHSFLFESGSLAVGSSKRSGKRYKALRFMLVALLAVLILGSIFTQAHDINVVKLLIAWTEEGFTVSNGHNKDKPAEDGEGAPKADDSSVIKPSANVLSYYWDIMDSYNIDEDIIVKWLPEDCEFGGFNYSDSAAGKSWYFYFPAWKHFIDPDMGFDGSRVGNIQILVNERLNGAGTALYEKDENPVTEYVIDGVTYYLMTNLSRQVAVWQNGVYDCSITGDISREELIKIVYSLYSKRGKE
jgi:hypothetical protein